MAEPGKWYLGVGAGHSRYYNWTSKTELTDIRDTFGSRLGIVSFTGTQGANVDNDATGYKLFAGYSFHEYFALETSYIDMGKVDGYSRASGTFYDAVNNSLAGDSSATASARVNALTLDLKLNVPIVSIAELLLKAGVYTADTSLNTHAGSSISTENFSYSRTENSTGAHYGMGINFRLTDIIGLRAEWERLELVEANDGKNHVDLVSAAITYQF